MITEMALEAVALIATILTIVAVAVVLSMVA
jgi:hypothetical protein